MCSSASSLPVDAACVWAWLAESRAHCCNVVILRMCATTAHWATCKYRRTAILVMSRDCVRLSTCFPLVYRATPRGICAASVRAFISMATQSPFEYINTSDAQIMKTESHNLARKASRRTRAPPQTNSHSKRRAQALATCPPDLRSCIKVPRECLCPTSACITSLDMPDHATARSANWRLATSTPGSAAPNRRMLHTSITAVA